MTYQTPELLAKQTINRLISAKFDGTAVWIFTSHLTPENRHPRKMNMLAHLLMPLTNSGKCRPFFLTNNDILLVGDQTIATGALPIIDQMRGVLSDDPFIVQNGGAFFTTFSLSTQKELLLSGLDTLSCEPPASKQIPDLYPLIQDILKKKDLTDFMPLHPVVRLTPTLKQQSGLLCLPNTQSLIKTAVADTALVPDWMRQSFNHTVRTHLLETFGFLNTFSGPILLPLNAADITTPAFDFFMGRRKTPTAFVFPLTDLLDEKIIEAAQKKCHSLRYKWGFILQNAAELSLIDFTKTGPDYIVLSGSDITPETLPVGLKKEIVLLMDIDTETKLFNALRAGFSLFSGPLITTLVGVACQEACPYGDTCTPGTCGRAHAGETSACAFPSFRQEYVFRVSEEEK